MPKRVEIPAALRGTAFRTSDRAEHGLGRGRLRNADVQHPFHSMSAIDLDLLTITGMCRAYEPLLSAGHYFSHSTAAALYGMPMPDRMPLLPLHLSTRGSGTPPRRAGVSGHALTADDVSVDMVNGLPVVSAADTWCHLASQLSREDLVAVGDFLITGPRLPGGSRGPAPCSVQQLEQAVIRHRGRRGAKVLAWAVPRLRSGVDSRPESLLRLLLAGSGLPEPLVNDPVLVDGGGITLHPDLHLERWHVVLEYEGDGHRTSKRQFRRDILRRELFEAASYRVIRVTAADLFEYPDAFLERVHTILKDRERQGW
ncbi:hypothetical protein [Glaciihabitans sp. UYNi722]|uniref:hypothetical protein n=1 Tax=Glaciihabitans sp. UYNi722 TaxID=3156344 RepID=UPI003393FBE3